ncbi:MAG TPA: isoprenylcysteine carboxylmethyltransferase family protein [Steroidobacteraceae bacterium]|nr:isoprenylcysteine carboxylmethyltransferase family protein [Steroidobacteraceae bacterium]
MPMPVAIILARILFLALWVIWGLYWIVAARSAKPVLRRERLLWRVLFVAQALLTAVLLAPDRLAGWLGADLIGGGWARYWIAVAITTAGLALSIWARRILGGNWSGSVTLKENHELVKDGPYRWIRHPIYSGVLLMILGTALASGRAQGLFAFAIALSALYLRSRAEERWMESQFSERYSAYRKASWALVPFIF